MEGLDRLHRGSPSKSSRTPKPGFSVLTPGKKTPALPRHGGWDSDDDDIEEDENFGYSPPKTMQFHVPQSRLLKTPGMLLALSTPLFLYLRDRKKKRLPRSIPNLLYITHN